MNNQQIRLGFIIIPLLFQASCYALSHRYLAQNECLSCLQKNQELEVDPSKNSFNSFCTLSGLTRCCTFDYNGAQIDKDIICSIGKCTGQESHPESKNYQKQYRQCQNYQTVNQTKFCGGPELLLAEVNKHSSMNLRNQIPKQESNKTQQPSTSIDVVDQGQPQVQINNTQPENTTNQDSNQTAQDNSQSSNQSNSGIIPPSSLNLYDTSNPYPTSKKQYQDPVYCEWRVSFANVVLYEGQNYTIVFNVSGITDDSQIYLTSGSSSQVIQLTQDMDFNLTIEPSYSVLALVDLSQDIDFELTFYIKNDSSIHSIQNIPVMVEQKSQTYIYIIVGVGCAVVGIVGLFIMIKCIIRRKIAQNPELKSKQNCLGLPLETRQDSMKGMTDMEKQDKSDNMSQRFSVADNFEKQPSMNADELVRRSQISNLIRKHKTDIDEKRTRNGVGMQQTQSIQKRNIKEDLMTIHQDEDEVITSPDNQRRNKDIVDYKSDFLPELPDYLEGVDSPVNDSKQNLKAFKKSVISQNRHSSTTRTRTRAGESIDQGIEHSHYSDEEGGTTSGFKNKSFFQNSSPQRLRPARPQTANVYKNIQSRNLNTKSYQSAIRLQTAADLNKQEENIQLSSEMSGIEHETDPQSKRTLQEQVKSLHDYKQKVQLTDFYKVDKVDSDYEEQKSQSVSQSYHYTNQKKFFLQKRQPKLRIDQQNALDGSDRTNETKNIGQDSYTPAANGEISFTSHKAQVLPSLKDKEKIWDDIYSNSFMIQQSQDRQGDALDTNLPREP